MGRSRFWDAARTSGSGPGSSAHRFHEQGPPPCRSAQEPSGAESGTDGVRLQVYLRDMDNGDTTLIADEPLPGLIRTSCPKWSNDGGRILFHASLQPNDWDARR